MEFSDAELCEGGEPDWIAVIGSYIFERRVDKTSSPMAAKTMTARNRSNCGSSTDYQEVKQDFKKECG